MSQVTCNAPHTAASAHVLTSLYPLGMVPEISSVDVRHPAGQYLLRRREAHGEWGWAVRRHLHQAADIYLNSASGKSEPLSRQVIRSVKGKQSIRVCFLLNAPSVCLVRCQMTSQAKQEPKFQSLLKWIPPYFLVTLANVYMKGVLCVFVLSWTNSDENAGNSS